jgi:hypothetical protein
MTKKSRPSKPESKPDYSEAYLAALQKYLDACASAAVRCAGMLENDVRLRTRLAKRAQRAMGYIQQYCETPWSQRDISRKVGLESAQEEIALMASHTEQMKADLELFDDQLAALNQAYNYIQSAVGVKLIPILHEVSRKFFEHPSPVCCDAWSYVLRAWQEINLPAVQNVRAGK